MGELKNVYINLVGKPARIDLRRHKQDEGIL